MAIAIEIHVNAVRNRIEQMLANIEHMKRVDLGAELSD